MKFGAQIIYTDSYAVFKGATEWIGHWEANGWQVNWVPVWRTEDWRQLLEVGQGRALQVGWVKAHDKNLTEATHWNNKVEYLTHIYTLETDENTDAQEWARLREWLHERHGHTGKADLYKECQARGWPATVADCERTITHYPQCRLRLKMDHPNQAPPLHMRAGKTLWQTWQINYIGPLRTSNQHRYILVGVEVVSGLTQATATTAASGEWTI